MIHYSIRFTIQKIGLPIHFESQFNYQNEKEVFAFHNGKSKKNHDQEQRATKRILMYFLKMLLDLFFS